MTNPVRLLPLTACHLHSLIYRASERLELGLSAEETTMVGDTMETDILGGVGLGYRTILVLSGGTAEEDLGKFAYAPDMVLGSVAEIPEDLSFDCHPEIIGDRLKVQLPA